MSTVASVKPLTAGHCLRLSDVDWKTYSRLLYVFAQRRRLRLTYDRGELEIMSPLFEHDDDARFLGDMVVALTEVLGLPLKRGGSVTMRRQKKQRGIEADESFWIASASGIKKRRQLNLTTDPPPDLSIEVDLTHGSLDRLSIYAALGVPEVWRLDGDTLTFHVLDDQGHYQSVTASRSFPRVAPADLLGFVQQARAAVDENPIMEQFRAWIRQHAAAPPDNPSAGVSAST